MDTHTVVIHVTNQFGVLAKISSLFGRRGCNIHGMTVFPTGRQEVSQMTLVILGQEEKVRQIFNQMEKLEDVLTVTLSTVQAKDAV